MSRNEECLPCRHSWKGTKNSLLWKSHPIAKAGENSWKKPMGQACPHGLKIFIINGSHVRNSYDSDFDQGGNGWAYTFVPKNEIWIDSHVPVEERPYVAFHECHEAEDMKNGKSYDNAHIAAKRIEDKMRKRDRPGER